MVSNMKKCNNPTCTYFRMLELPDKKFCTNCGTQLVEAETCVCGESISTLDKFCPECGRPIQTQGGVNESTRRGQS